MNLTLSFTVDPDCAQVVAGMLDSLSEARRLGYITPPTERAMRADITGGNIAKWLDVLHYWTGNTCRCYVEPNAAFSRTVWGQCPLIPGEP